MKRCSEIKTSMKIQLGCLLMPCELKPAEELFVNDK